MTELSSGHLTNESALAERQSDVETAELVATALVAEFTSLRAEVAGRSASQQLLVNLNLTMIGLVLGVALSQQTGTAVILLIPIFASCCAMLYFDHAAQITKIGLYIGQVLRPRMRDIVCDDHVLAWESSYLAFHRRRVPTLLQFGIPTFVLFVGGPLSVCVVGIATIHGPLHWIAWAVGLTLEVIAGSLWYMFIVSVRPVPHRR